VRAFAELTETIDDASTADRRVEALVRHLTTASDEAAAWALFLLCGGRLERRLSPRRLRTWAEQQADVPDWLVDLAYDEVGDLTETISLLVAAPCRPTTVAPLSLDRWLDERLLPLHDRPDDDQRRAVLDWWSELPARECYVLNKLLTGGLSTRVRPGEVARAVARTGGLDPSVVARRLERGVDPTPAAYRSLLVVADDGRSRPYPFRSVAELDDPRATLGPIDGLHADWHFDGITVQCVRRAGQAWLWTKDDELLTERLPDVASAARSLPDGIVVEGTLLAWRDGRALPRADLTQRLRRARPDARLIADVPCRLIAHDLLETSGTDRRAEPLGARLERLEALCGGRRDGVVSAPIVTAADWSELDDRRAGARSLGARGLLLRQLGRPRTDTGPETHAWASEPLAIDAVLTYAEAGRSLNAHRLTSFSFGVWEEGELATFAKTGAGLEDEDERRELERWIRRHTTERFGPVRRVPPRHVFTIGFDAIAPSTRTRSGVTLQNPRVVRWRRDRKPTEAATLARVRRLLEP